MSARVTHRLVGHDFTTGRVLVEYPTPERHLGVAKKLAHVGEDDPHAVLCYRLDPPRAQDTADTIGECINTDVCIFYLEGFAV
jgi:hypothetical protein